MRNTVVAASSPHACWATWALFSKQRVVSMDGAPFAFRTQHRGLAPLFAEQSSTCETCMGELAATAIFPINRLPYKTTGGDTPY